MYDLSKVVVTSSPHIKTNESTRSIMLDVIIALMPALIVSVLCFGGRALVLTVVGAVSAVIFEAIYNKILNKPNTIGDLSAVVTGILLVYNVPVSMPIWMVIIGVGFAIIVAKCLFGGIGKNFINPALAGRAFLMASWASAMTTWVGSGTKLALFSTPVDVVTEATPLSYMKNGELAPYSLMDLFVGQTGGCLGEISAAALIIGGLYLVFRKVITLRTPLAYILTVAVITFLFPKGDNSHVMWMMQNLLSGGLMLGAFFMATDYTTSPVTPKGQIVFGIGCGLITLLIRYFGGYPEGVSYSILIMNCLVWAIDKVCLPKKFGYVEPEKKSKEVKA